MLMLLKKEDGDAQLVLGFRQQVAPLRVSAKADIGWFQALHRSTFRGTQYTMSYSAYEEYAAHEREGR